MLQIVFKQFRQLNNPGQVNPCPISVKITIISYIQ